MPFEPTMSLAGNSSKVREELRRPGLRFSGAVEREFIDFLRESQRASAVALAAVGFVIFGIFAALDFYRFQALQDVAYAAELFRYGVVLPRLLCVVGLFAAAVIVRFRFVPRATALVIAGIYLLIGLAIFLSTATYNALGLPHATSSYVLVIVAVFLPCGLLFRECMALGAVLCACALAMANWVLVIQHAEQQWLFMVIVVMSFVLSGVSAYMRERAQREQFLLRKLVDWDADHDSLTGLLNRRAFTEAAERCVLQAHRERTPLALAIIDIDCFKAYNDLYGHVAGDKALSTVSEHIARCVRRPMDLAVRLGGEEFGLLSYGEHSQSLEARIRQCQSELDATCIPHDASSVAPHLTFSAGVAELRDSADSLASLYWRADVSLYLAKERGRNCVVGDVASERLGEAAVVDAEVAHRAQVAKAGVQAGL